METKGMRKKLYAVLFVLILGAAAIAGCGTSDGAEQAAKEDAQVTKAEVTVSKNENQTQKKEGAGDVLVLSSETAAITQQSVCTVEGCTIANCDGVHHTESGRTCTLEGCTIENCDGIHHTEPGRTCTLEGCMIENCDGIHHTEPGRTCTVEGCTIENCDGVHGGSASHHNGGQGRHHGNGHH